MATREFDGIAGMLSPRSYRPAAAAPSAPRAFRQWVVANRWLAATLAVLTLTTAVLVVLVSVSLARPRRPLPAPTPPTREDAEAAPGDGARRQEMQTVALAGPPSGGVDARLATLQRTVEGVEQWIGAAERAYAYQAQRPAVARASTTGSAHFIPQSVLFGPSPVLYLELDGTTGPGPAVFVLPHVTPRHRSVVLTVGDGGGEVLLTTLSRYDLGTPAFKQALFESHGLPQNEGLRPQDRRDQAWAFNPAIFLGPGAPTPEERCRFVFLRGCGTQIRLTCSRMHPAVLRGLANPGDRPPIDAAQGFDYSWTVEILNARQRALTEPADPASYVRLVPRTRPDGDSRAWEEYRRAAEWASRAIGMGL